MWWRVRQGSVFQAGFWLLWLPNSWITKQKWWWNVRSESVKKWSVSEFNHHVLVTHTERETDRGGEDHCDTDSAEPCKKKKRERERPLTGELTSVMLVLTDSFIIRVHSSSRVTWRQRYISRKHYSIYVMYVRTPQHLHHVHEKHKQLLWYNSLSRQHSKISLKGCGSHN